jgi:hypothetical protein
MHFRLLFLFIFCTSALTGQFFTTAYHGAYLPPRFITSGMVLDYEFDNTNSYSGSGSTTVVDLWGNSNATLSSSAMTYAASPGYVTFTRANSNYILTNTSLTPDMINTSVSIFAWIYITGNGVIVSELGQRVINDTYHASLIEMAGGALKFRVWNNGVITSSITPLLNRWYYVGFTYDQATSTMIAYLNGQNVGSLTGITKAIPTNLYYGIGALDATSLGDGGYGSFRLGAFHVFNRALKSSEALLNYNGSRERFDYGLVMDLSTPPSTGTTWTDLSGAGNNGTLIGTPTYVATNGGGYTLGAGKYISTNYNLSNYFTVSIVASLTPSSYWATFWGNETWSSSKGYLAYFLNSTSIDIGPAGGLQNYTFSGINTIHFYDFVFNGTSLTVYVDGVSKGTTTISLPSGGLSTNGLYFGARHNNTGTSYTDVCPGTYYSMRVYKKPLDATTVSTIFNAMRSTYGL